MSQISDEQFSAFLDGELPDVELDMVLSRLDRDISGRQKLARYVMIGECLRTGRAMPDPLDLAERVRESLRTEDARVVPGRPAGFVRRRYAGLAAGLAAGVILAMVIMARPGWWQQNSAPVVAAVADSSEFPEGSLELIPPRAAHRLDPVAAARLTRYLVVHGEYANRMSRSNFDSHLVSAHAERAVWRQTGAISSAR